MPSPITTVESHEMRGLWWHLLKDSMRRGWNILVLGALLALAYLYTGIVYMIDLEQPGTSAIGAIAAAFMVLLFGSIYASVQYPSYPLLAALPISRVARGRFVWAQHVAVMPAAYYVVALLAAVLGTALKPGAGFLGWVLSPLYVSVMAVALTSPALMLLFWKRPSLDKPRHFPIAVYAPLGTLAWWAYINSRRGMPFAIAPSCLPILAVASVLALAASYARAPRLVVGTRAGNETARWFRWVQGAPGLVKPLGPGRISPLWRLVLLEPLRGAPYVLIFLAMWWFRGDERGRGMVLSLFAGACALTGFTRAGVLGAERARLMCALPLTPTELAAAIMAYGVAASAYAAIATALLMAALPDGSPVALINGVLLGVSLGSFAPVIFLRYSRSAREWAGLYPVAVMFLFMLTLISQTLAKPGLLPLLAVAAPLCIIISTLLLREVLRYHTAYQYRKSPIQAMNEG
jgi:hypothetical protein